MVGSAPTPGGRDLRRLLFAIATAAVLALLLGLGACGLTRVRASQDWSGADDPRLALSCHVGNYGSGVLLSCDGEGATVLTCAHLVEDEGDDVDVSFHDPATGGWVTYEGEVVRRSHPHKEDLAEIRIRTVDFHLPPQVTPLADPVEPGSETTASIANIAFGAEDRPFVLDLPARAHLASVSSFRPDADGATDWRLPKLLVHGGITQANSGSPVFLGEALLGLAESSPAFLPTADGVLLTGVQAGTPQEIRAFLEGSSR